MVMDPTSEDILVRKIENADTDAVSDIYNHYVSQTIITFEEQEVSASEMCRRVEEVLSDSLPWLVAEQSGEIVGYAYASRWKGRCAYRFSTEVTVYVKPAFVGNGIGSRLYDRLLPLLQNCGIHTAIGGIALPNENSIALHEKFGFQKIAHFKEVGFKFNKWIDVGYWQRIL